MHQLSLAIVGINYPNKRGPARRFELAVCVPGEPVNLVPEPKNEADEHAIAVFSLRSVQLGYLSSERAVLIGSQLRRGVEVRAIFQALGENVAWCRVAFNGEAPILSKTEARRQIVDADGFYPDDPAGEWGA